MVDGANDADPLGRAMRDYQLGEPGRLVYRDGPEIRDGRVREFYFTPPESWDDETLANLERLAEPGGPVLDVGCGSGQHLRWFRDCGVEAVGVDVSPNAVTTARERGVEDVVVGDMRALPFADGRFRSLQCVGTQLGLGGSLPGITALLAEFDRVTSGDAVAVVDNYDPARLDDDFLGYRPDPREGIGHRCFHFEYERSRGDRVVGPTLHFLLCSPAWLEGAAAGTPWAVTDVVRSEEEDAYYRATLEVDRSAEPTEATL